jgi:putative tryptophan/tyrosine transport system substrate-binding protein
LTADLQPKRLQLLRELIPNAAVFGVLVDPASSYIQSRIADLKTAARKLGLQLVAVTYGGYQAILRDKKNGVY